MTVPIDDWVFYFEGGTNSTKLRFELSPIHSNMNAPSLYKVFGNML